MYKYTNKINPISLKEKNTSNLNISIKQEVINNLTRVSNKSFLLMSNNLLILFNRLNLGVLRLVLLKL
jgi:hypothetical protein